MSRESIRENNRRKLRLERLFDPEFREINRLARLLDPEDLNPKKCDYCGELTDPKIGWEFDSKHDPKAIFCSKRCVEKWEGAFRCGGIHE